MLGSLLCLVLLAEPATSAVPVAPPAPPVSTPIVFDRFDVNHSTIGFTVSILDGWSEVEGKFTKFSIRVAYDPADVARGTVTADIDAASIDTGIADRDQDLRSPGFFDTAKYPQITFRSQRLERRGDAWVAIGTCGMHGVEKACEIPFKILGPRIDGQNKAEIAIAAAVELDRDDYGITWRHQIADFVGPKVRVRLRLLSKLTPLPVVH